ncbi:1-acyl-sn-glycerol-3-phosphate acyltransferase [Halodesulfovibrio sp. MK-HDV]|jgi:1-acyl-sn-glycerol-3-phosphate acyltransferase|nr:1-acyl-sn-glycerol-3-phosphate acyltransferase [Halodesulfovibrio sp. MK-HDV]
MSTSNIKKTSRLYTVLLLCFLLLHTLGTSIAMLIASPYYLFVRKMPLDKMIRHFIWLYGKGYVWCTRLFIPASLSWEGANPFPLQAPAVIVMNHYSILDLYYLGLLLNDGDIVFVTQRRPFLIKLYAPFMSMAKYIDMRTGDFSSCLEQCKKHLENGSRVLFFPEAGRSRDGTLQPFKSGPFWVAKECNVPIIPFCISGTDILLPAGAREITPAQISLHILEPIDPEHVSGDFPHRMLKKTVHLQMKQVLERQKNILRKTH